MVGAGIHSNVYLPDSMLRFFKFIFIYFMWDLVNSPEMEPGAPAWGAWSLSCWTTREVPVFLLKANANSDYQGEK